MSVSRPLLLLLLLLLLLRCPCPVLLEKDSLQTRLTVDGVPFRESSSIFRTVTRMAGSGSLTGSMVLNLTAGTHTVQLQWQKTGSGVASWWSQPEFLDGFVTSRSLVVFQERFEMLYHQALTSSDPSVDPRLVWRDVNEASAQVCVVRAVCSVLGDLDVPVSGELADIRAGWLAGWRQRIYTSLHSPCSLVCPTSAPLCRFSAPIHPSDLGAL